MKKLAFMILVVALTSTGCKSAAGLVLTEDAVHDALARLDDQEKAFCKAPANVDLYKAPCSDLNPVMISALQAGASFNRAVAAQKVSGLADLITALGNVATQLKKLPSGATVQMFTEIANAIKAAATVAGGK